MRFALPAPPGTFLAACCTLKRLAGRVLASPLAALCSPPPYRWLRILRSLRILRLVLLSGNLPVMKLSTSALLSGSVNARLLQLVASVMALLFTSAR